MTKIFKTPFAAQGDRVAIPNEVQPDGAVSYTQGYGYDYERDQNTDPAAKDIEREKMNGIFHDLTEAVGEMQTFGVAQWSTEAQPYPVRAVVYYKQKLWQSRIENNKEAPTTGNAWIELKADLTAGDVGAYSKEEANQQFQPLGNYTPAGYSYGKEEADNRFQPKGNYQSAGNYALRGESYTKPESDGKYQPVGNYLAAGYSYSKDDSDGRFQPKGNYAPAGSYAPKGESYTKPESDSRYQSKGNYAQAGNYAVRGESYTKGESDGKFQPRGNYQPAGNYAPAGSYQPAGNYAVRGESYTKGESDGRYQSKSSQMVRIYFGGTIKPGDVVGLSEDVRGKTVYFFNERGAFFMHCAPVDGITYWVGGDNNMRVSIDGGGRRMSYLSGNWIVSVSMTK
ncbi:hypothetical protein [Xenorhabdus innexi]|uniref:Phage tail protein n=1 Tax=Xenorhabdus innexi TaxID=290109 RepID=A0A1N6MZD7_9GAMM|nr:hypothetical protein [Xenorhabdus innexi]PHM33084.1 phage tail protein [Xenorhabdus innexi]SIP74182.1 Phage-related tail fiber protein [Xenorhabdus innexi]